MTFSQKYYHRKKKIVPNYNNKLPPLSGCANLEEAERIAVSNPQCALQMFDRKRE